MVQKFLLTIGLGLALLLSACTAAPSGSVPVTGATVTAAVPTLESAATAAAPTLESAASAVAPTLESAATAAAPTLESAATAVAPTLESAGTAAAGTAASAGVDVNSLPTVFTSAVQQAIALGMSVQPSEVKINSAQQTSFSDACLGLPKTGESCAQVVTPGYLLNVTVSGKTYEVHASQDGTNVRWK